mgnify:CR=1 FL=1
MELRVDNDDGIDMITLVAAGFGICDIILNRDHLNILLLP